MFDTDNKDHQDKHQKSGGLEYSKTNPLQSPGSLALMTLLAGPHISMVPALSVLARLSTSFIAKIAVLLAGLSFPVLYMTLLLWKTKWYWTTLTVSAAHIVCAAFYYLLFKKLLTRKADSYITDLPPSARQDKKYILAGIIGGISLVPILGAPLILLFLLASDKLLLTLMPLAFDDTTSIYLLIIATLGLIATGLITGGWAGRLALRLTPARTILKSLILVWISLLWFFSLILVIMLPAFLSSQAQSNTMGSTYSIFIIGNLLLGCWWSAYIFMYSQQPTSAVKRILRALYAPAICLSSAIIFGLVCGYPSNWFYSAGKYFEKSGRLTSALWCYELGLSKNPTGPHASYLQYRIALGEHKLGNREKAARGFRKIVSMYNYDERLVDLSNQFLDNLERNNPQSKRVVLPGVDNPTTYKGAYCVPNSLALVMNFWGAKIAAADIGNQITSLAGGTMTVDQTWFARQNGFLHQFIPMATIADIKLMIDAGFPVMVYVPQHVFVIVGYDELLETFVTYDVATADVWVEYLQEDFIKSWKKENSTMIIAYPDNKQPDVPVQIAKLAEQRSDSYFQYHLYQLQSYSGDSGSSRLEYAARNPTPYFFPVVNLFRNYPSNRPKVINKFDISEISRNIDTFYGRDFDEGIHLAGQYHDSSYADTDENLKQSIDFLIGTGRLQETKHLIEQIESNGIISDDTSETLAMVNLAVGDMEQAITQLEEQDDSQLHFYLALSHLKQGQVRNAIPGLVKTVDDCT